MRQGSIFLKIKYEGKMRKEFSLFLIALLLLLSPVLFSWGGIFNDVPDCSITSISVSIKAVSPLDGSTDERILPLESEKREFTSSPITLTDNWLKNTQFGRAPPA